MLPRTESTYVVHEMIHVLDSILPCGPCAANNLFSFERGNLLLKRGVKNQAKPIASIVRNYLRMEQSFRSSYYSLESTTNLSNSLKYCPSLRGNESEQDDTKLTFLNLMNEMFVEVDSRTGEETLHYIPGSPLLFLKGATRYGTIRGKDFENLMQYLGSIAESGCLLERLQMDWEKDILDNPRRRKQPTFLSRLARYAEDETDRDDFEAKNPDLRRYEYEHTYFEDYQMIVDLGMYLICT